MRLMRSQIIHPSHDFPPNVLLKRSKGDQGRLHTTWRARDRFRSRGRNPAHGRPRPGAYRRRPATLWYGRPAAEWLEALPVGCGRLGAMVFGGVATERLQLNEDSVWAGGPHVHDNPEALAALPQIRQWVWEDEWQAAQNLADQKFLGKPSEQAPYQVLGDLTLTYPGSAEFTEYRRALDLTQAVTTVTFVRDGVRHTREVFASNPDQVIVVRHTADKPGSVTFQAAFTSPQATTTAAAGRDTIALDGVSGDTQGLKGEVRFRALARAEAKGGTVRTDGGTLVVEGADEVTLLISMGTSYRSYKDASGDPAEVAGRYLRRAGGKPYEVLRRRHVRDYTELFGRVGLDPANYADLLDDPELRRAALVTLLVAAAGTAGLNLIGLGFALLVNGASRANTFFRIVLFYPHVLSALVVGFLWSAILGTTGAVNNLVTTWGGQVLPRFDSRGRLVIRAARAGTYTTTLSDGRTLTTPIPGPVPEPRELSSWRLRVEDWRPGSTPSQTSKAVHELALDRLAAWRDIPDLADVSGVGTYTTRIDLGADWDDGAYLELGEVTDTCRVRINGHHVDPIEQLHPIVDVGPCLRRGTNTIEVEVATPLGNRLRVADPTVYGGLTRQAYGLIGPVRLVPYREARVGGP
ncbi:glycoside hydrolase N-terminal domain-containing protein [Nonomuraea sp. B12E4]|uniref:glycoside hydrolase N-terminal domain-containing protein n=1 Tax=Nonomuraea sp. B12E4 TaxID=3153564 RepID=UPI00325EC04E